MHRKFDQCTRGVLYPTVLCYFIHSHHYHIIIAASISSLLPVLCICILIDFENIIRFAIPIFHIYILYSSGSLWLWSIR